MAAAADRQAHRCDPVRARSRTRHLMAAEPRLPEQAAHAGDGEDVQVARRVERHPVGAEQAVGQAFGIRREHDQDTARLEDAVTFLQRRDRIRQVLDDVAELDRVEQAGLEFLVEQVALVHRQAPAPGGCDRFGVELDPDRFPAKFAKKPHRVAAAAADVEEHCLALRLSGMGRLVVGLHATAEPQSEHSRAEPVHDASRSVLGVAGRQVGALEGRQPGVRLRHMGKVATIGFAEVFRHRRRIEPQRAAGRVGASVDRPFAGRRKHPVIEIAICGAADTAADDTVWMRCTPHDATWMFEVWFRSRLPNSLQSGRPSPDDRSRSAYKD